MTRRDIYGNSHKHVFLAVVPGGDDPFYGVKSVLFEMGITDIIDEVFSPSVNEIVRQVEYSYKLYFRAFFYRKVFVELRAILNQHLSDAEDHRLTIYVADEGFWTGFIWDAILSLKSSMPLSNILLINIQHGYFEPSSEKAKNKQGFFLRKIFNIASKAIFGFECYGFGFGGGRGVDKYLVYSNSCAEFLRSKGHSRVLSAPEIIKKNLIEQYCFYNLNSGSTAGLESNKNILFVMPYFLKGIGPTLPMGEFLNSFCFIFTELVAAQFKIKIRFHPGMDWDYCKSVLKNSEISDLVSVDHKKNLAESLSLVKFILGFNSTVMFDGFLLGLVPVNLLTHYYPSVLNFEHELIDVDTFQKRDIPRIFNSRIIEKYHKPMLAAEMPDEIINVKSFLNLC